MAEVTMLGITVADTSPTIRALQSIAKALDPDPISDEVGALLLNRMRQRFLAQVSPDGIPWIPSRAAQRRKKSGSGGGTLFDTGKLFRSLQFGILGAGQRWLGTDATDDRTGIYYPGLHQFGIGFPVREFIGIGLDDVSPVLQVVIDRITKVLSNVQ